jgi:hypothetical protein
MEYCNQGDNPIIKYKFGNGGYRFFKSTISPIEVKTKSVPIPSTDSYNNEGFTITANIYNYSSPTITIPIRDYKVTEILPHQPFYGGSNRYVYFQLCEDDKIDEVTSAALDMSTFQINNQIKCTDSKNKRCSIQVFSEESILIFQDQGDCPVSVEVQCGNCPPHNIECKANHYPGYCCIPCESTAQKIHNLANRIK